MIHSKFALKRLDDFAELSSGTTPSRDRQTDFFENGEVPWVKTGDLNNSTVVQTDELLTGAAIRECNVRVYPRQTVLVAMYGGFKQIGRTGMLGMDAAINQAICAVQVDQSVCDPAFLQVALNCRVGLWRRLAASSRKDPNVTGRDVGFFRVPFPQLELQIAIAAFSLAFNRQLHLVRKSISLREQRRRGLVAEMLGGHRRLPSYKSAMRRSIRLGDLFTERLERDFDDLPLLSVTANNGVVDRDSLIRKDTSNADKSNYKRIVAGDIVYNTMRMWQGVSAVVDKEGIVSPAYTVVTPNDDVDCRFAGLLFKNPAVINQFYRYSQGLVDDTLNLKYRHFSLIRVNIPGESEQRDLVRLFSKIDREIDSFKRLARAIEIQKRGVLERLLSGELPIPDHVVCRLNAEAKKEEQKLSRAAVKAKSIGSNS